MSFIHFCFLFSFCFSYQLSKLILFLLVFFLLQLSFPCSRCYYTWHPLCISLKLSFLRVWPLQNFLVGRHVFIFSDPVCMVVLMQEYSSRVLGSNFCPINQMFVSLCSWLIFLDSTLLHRLLPGSYIPSNGVSANASVHLLSTGTALYFLSLILSSVMRWLLTFLQTFCMYLTKFLDGEYLVSSFPRHFEKSAFSGFRRYEPQTWKSCTTNHSRENLFRAPFRTEMNISLNYGQYSTQFTQLIWQMYAVSINVKGNTERGTIFSKMWSENISSIFTKDLRCHPPSRAVSCHHVIRNSLCAIICYYSFAWIYQHQSAQHSRSREYEHNCYVCFCKACIIFTHIFGPFACCKFSRFWAKFETWSSIIQNSCLVLKNSRDCHSFTIPSTCWNL